MSRSKVISKFERLLFKGVPEQAEDVYQRNDNSYATNRKRGMSQNGTKYGDVSTASQVTGYLKFDLEKGTCEYVSTIEEE